MHQGTFPELPSPLSSPVAYGRSPRGALVLDHALPSRRQWLLAIGGVLVGGTAVWAFGGWNRTPTQPPVKGSLAWALALRDQPAEELIRWAGDLERTAATLADPRLVPVFEALLDAVLVRRGEIVDQAGACAVRSLAALGASEAIAARRQALQGKPDLAETQAALESLPANGGRR